MKDRIRHIYDRVNNYLSVKYVGIFFALLAALYIFSLFGSMFGSSNFTYADF